MENLKKHLKDMRPSLSNGSVTTYASILSSLYKKVFGSSDEMDIHKFQDAEKILDYLKDVAPNKRKTVLSALVVVTGGMDVYRHQMLQDIGEYKKNIAEQEMSPAQQASWLKPDEIHDHFDHARVLANMLYKNCSKNMPMTAKQTIQNFVLLAVLGGIFIPPRRSLDWTEFKVKNINPAEDNYLDLNNNRLVFNRYKTAKTYGQQSEPCPPGLKQILMKFISVDPSREYLFFDSNGDKLTSSKLHQRFASIFGKNASVNNLRHSYLTERFGKTILENQVIANTMKALGSSPAQLVTYVKKE